MLLLDHVMSDRGDTFWILATLHRRTVIVPVVLSGNNIDFVHETKYLGLIINSSMNTSSDVVRQNVN